MAAPDFSDISKPLDGRIGVNSVVPVMPLPAYGDLSKAANDVSAACQTIETARKELPH
jgi:voltage-dependent anion channel protein 2